MSAQRGYILPLVLFGSVAILSGIGLLFYFFIYRPQQVALTPLPTPNNSTSFVTESVVDFESCVKAGNPIMESYPRRCNAEGKSFTEIIVEPTASSSAMVTDSKTYQDNEITFLYASHFEGGEGSANDQLTLNRSEQVKSYSFGTQSTDEGFSIHILTNDQNLSLQEWWNMQYENSRSFSFYNNVFPISAFNPVSKRIGLYDVYTLDYDAQGRYMLFAFKNRIIFLTTTTDEESIITTIK